MYGKLTAKQHFGQTICEVVQNVKPDIDGVDNCGNVYH